MGWCYGQRPLDPSAVKPLLALSTSWCSGRHTDGYAMVREMVDLGFQRIELSHGIRITLVPGILRAVEEGLVTIPSTHNFCPLPAGVNQAAPNVFEPSKRERRENDQWIRHTKRSIDFAVQVGAKVLVTHLGSVHFFWRDPGGQLLRYVNGHPWLDVWQHERYRRRVAAAVARVRKSGARDWTQVRTSLDAVREHALAKGVTLGFENRERLEELPLDDEFPTFFRSLSAPHGSGYWHDTGHAEIKQRLGLLEHRRHLEANAAQLVGFHLHDVDSEGHDHCALGEGIVDFWMVSAFWQPHHLLTLELSPRVSVEQVSESRERVERLINQRFATPRASGGATISSGA
jgi:sugar phosphate isomerase/epimerase